MTTTAVILSVLALVLSLLSLGWQAWTWSRSGPVLVVEVSNIFTGAATSSAYGPGEVEHYVQVAVVNRGRAAATIDSWGIETPGGKNLVALQPLPFSTRLPARVEPHSSLSVHMAGDELRRKALEHQISFKAMRAWVGPATGKKVYAKKGIPLA